MNKRGVGVAFIAISALLISSKYISAAIFGSGVASWDKSLYDAMLSYVGNTLSTFSVVTFVVGVGYIVWAERENWKGQESERNDKEVNS
ncbi:hypothetical protein [Mesobacillus subterraneus]|uniref:Uncharacterized protein n=1 Tax=Mesobacillus subterraneus TaxID=285983 RepID=A0A3R9KXP9_9BACI|nr:hypothetical protein [Mesobacillus subterraneus]RSD28428.1 hypothetical protein EJA10_04905 [Mesobacillus subterraneus]